VKILTYVVDVLFLIENCGLLVVGWYGWKLLKSPFGSLLGAAAVTDMALSGQRGVKAVADLAMENFKAPGE
jgi:hypothetical protein